MRESVVFAMKGRRYVDHVKTRLDFSKDSESGSSKAATGAATRGWQIAAEELGEVLAESSESDDELEDRRCREDGGGDSQRPTGLHEGLWADVGQRQRVALHSMDGMPATLGSKRNGMPMEKPTTLR